MQYDLKKVLEDKGKLSLTWHGEDTMVLLDKRAGEKVLVKTGETVEVSMKTAQYLLKYSEMWTLEGDEPVGGDAREARKGAFKALEDRRKARINKRKRKGAPTEEAGDADVAPDLSPARIGKMKRVEVESALTHLEVEFDPKEYSSPELKELLLAKVEGITENAEDVDAPDAPDAADTDEADENDSESEEGADDEDEEGEEGTEDDEEDEGSEV